MLDWYLGPVIVQYNILLHCKWAQHFWITWDMDMDVMRISSPGTEYLETSMVPGYRHATL